MTLLKRGLTTWSLFAFGDAHRFFHHEILDDQNSFPFVFRFDAFNVHLAIQMSRDFLRLVAVRKNAGYRPAR